MIREEPPSVATPHLRSAIGDDAATLASIAGVGTAVPASVYTQDELLSIMNVEDPRIRSLFRNSAIDRRHLCLPPPQSDGSFRAESQGELLRKHVSVGLRLGQEAIEACLTGIGADLTDIRHLCCVSSTGFITPGFSAMLIKELGIDNGCSRIDIVGMGCNAGLNALAQVSAWARCHTGELAVMVCIEVCSAAYVFDGTMRSSVVNSLFGDGAAAAAVISRGGRSTGPAILAFESRLSPEAINAMRYDWSDPEGRFSFFLDPMIPYVIGANVEAPVNRLLGGAGLRRSDVRHWVLHSGGKKVIDSIRINLGLTRYDVRHTSGVLRDFGNLSSGAFLFAFERLTREQVVSAGDYGLLMTMGPGSTIETALLRW